MVSPTRPAASPASRRLMSVLFIGVFMAALDTAVIAPAIPALREAFHVDNREVGLVITVYVLFSLSCTALMANLSDRHGRRPVYLAGVGCFALGSLLIALAPSFGVLLAGRAIQGIGAGGIIPTASVVIGDVLPPEEHGRALGLMGATYGMAFVFGPPLAGLIMVVASWNWIFLANLPIAALILYLGARALPAKPREGALPPLDVPGTIVVFLLLVSLVLGITRVADHFAGERLWPWFLAAAAALVAVLVPLERRAVQPMIPLGLFRNRQLVMAYVLTVGAGFGMGGVMFLTSIAHFAYGVSTKHAGFVLLPLVVCSMIGSMGAGRLLNRVGVRGLVLLGFAMLAVGYGACAVTAFGLPGFLVASMPVGLGVGIVVGGALRTIAIDEAPVAVRGTAQGLVNISNAIGTLLSSAVIGAVADFGGGGVPGFRAAYVLCAALMVAMFLLTFALRRSRVRQPAGAAA